MWTLIGSIFKQYKIFTYTDKKTACSGLYILLKFKGMNNVEVMR